MGLEEEWAKKTVKSSWTEKYKPLKLDDMVLPTVEIRKVLQDFYDNSFVKGNILSYGKPGLGKTAVKDVFRFRIIKGPHDVFVLDRKIEDVDNLKRWLQYRPSTSKQKIVLIEEMDKLTKPAQTALKDGLMENHQHNCTFIATTNNPHAIDPALLTRFRTKINFVDLPEDKVFERLKFILQAEKVAFKEEELKAYTNMCLNKGMRELVNDIEQYSQSGEFKPNWNIESTVITTTKITNEDKVVSTSVQEETNRLVTKYNKSVLSLEETAKELSMSKKTLSRHIKSNPQDIPKYKEIGSGTKIFSIRVIAEYLTS